MTTNPSLQCFFKGRIEQECRIHREINCWGCIEMDKNKRWGLNWSSCCLRHKESDQVSMKQDRQRKMMAILAGDWVKGDDRNLGFNWHHFDSVSGSFKLYPGRLWMLSLSKFSFCHVYSYVMKQRQDTVRWKSLWRQLLFPKSHKLEVKELVQPSALHAGQMNDKYYNLAILWYDFVLLEKIIQMEITCPWRCSLRSPVAMVDEKPTCGGFGTESANILYEYLTACVIVTDCFYLCRIYVNIFRSGVFLLYVPLTYLFCSHCFASFMHLWGL